MKIRKNIPLPERGHSVGRGKVQLLIKEWVVGDSVDGLTHLQARYIQTKALQLGQKTEIHVTGDIVNEHGDMGHGVWRIK